MASQILQTVKDNPIKIVMASSGSIIAIVSALFTIDARYAHASDFEKERQQTHTIIQETTQNLRRQMLEDKLFEIDVKKAQAKDQKLSPIDSALRDRYQRQIDELKR